MDNQSVKFQLRNHMESVVNEKLDGMLQQVDICKCSKCKMDIMAYALNLLSPKYVVTNTGDLYSRLEEFTAQFEIDIQVAVMEAIKVVSQNPKH